MAKRKLTQRNLTKKGVKVASAKKRAGTPKPPSNSVAILLSPRRGMVRTGRDWLAGRIHEVRGQQVMLDADLAELYGVETRAVVQAIKRNARRFPADFVFRLTAHEAKDLTSQSVISTPPHGGRRHLPYAFTELGIGMLSSVLRSDRAIEAHLFLMRAFFAMRRALATHGELTLRVQRQSAKRAACTGVLGGTNHAALRFARVQQIEDGHKKHGAWIDLLAGDMEQLRLPPPEPPKRRIGFPTKSASAKAGA